MSKMRQCSFITDENRNAIFEKFWKTMSLERKKMYVVSLVEKSRSGPKNDWWTKPERLYFQISLMEKQHWSSGMQKHVF